MRKIAVVVMLVVLTTFSALGDMPTPAKPAAPTFQELMDPALFPNPQMGMEVESAQIQENVLRIRTTGACIDVELATGDVHFSQTSATSGWWPCCIWVSGWKGRR